MTVFIEHPTFWFYLIDISLIIATLLHMLYQRRSPQNLMAWTLTLLLLPFIGVMLYIIFGSRKLLYAKRRKAKISLQPVSELLPDQPFAQRIERLLRANHIAGSSNDNQAHLCPNGEAAFQRLLSLIEKAQQQIHLQTYILENDTTGQAILEALTDKARQGVEVRLLLDAIGSFKLYLHRKPLTKLQQAGGQFAFFQPPLHSLLKSQINLRNHRKIYLFDQQTLLTGGMNLSNDYLGANPHAQRWQDLMIEIRGSSLTHYQNIFNEDWFYTTGERLPTRPADHPAAITGEIVQVIPSGPDIDSDALFETLLQGIHMAQEEIEIVTPYFIPDSDILNALLIAVKRGVRVTLISPQKSDHLLFDLGRSSYMRELAEQGGKILLYPHTMLHAKLVMIDRQNLFIGSANLDYRSLFINHEVVNCIYSSALITDITTWLNPIKQASIPYYPPHQKGRRLFENLTRIFAPIL